MDDEAEIQRTKGLLCIGDDPLGPAEVLTRNGFSMVCVQVQLADLPPLPRGELNFLPEN